MRPEWGLPGAGPAGALYMVALASHIVEAEEAQLARELEPGQRVSYSAPDGSHLDASVAELNASHWCAACFLFPCLYCRQLVSELSMHGVRDY